MRTISLKIDEKLLERIDKYVAKKMLETGERITRSDVIRMALEKFLEEEENEQVRG